MQYPKLNLGHKLFLDRPPTSGISNNTNFINKNQKHISISGKNTNRNKIFYKRNNVNYSENRIINKNKNVHLKNNTNENKKNKNDCINYFNALSTMFMKTENNNKVKKYTNSNANSVNSRVSNNSKKSKNSNSKNSKSSKSSKNSKKKYNLIRQAIKHQAGNFIFNKKGGSEGKTTRFLQHYKLFNINNFKKNAVPNINNILDNCLGINNNNNLNNNYLSVNKDKDNEVNNIRIIRPKNNKGKKTIYKQINFESITNMYNLNTKNKKNYHS